VKGARPQWAQLLGLKERRIGLQAAEEGVPIVVAFDFTLA